MRSIRLKNKLKGRTIALHPLEQLQGSHSAILSKPKPDIFLICVGQRRRLFHSDCFHITKKINKEGSGEKKGGGEEMRGDEEKRGD